MFIGFSVQVGANSGNNGDLNGKNVDNEMGFSI